MGTPSRHPDYTPEECDELDKRPPGRRLPVGVVNYTATQLTLRKHMAMKAMEWVFKKETVPDWAVVEYKQCPLWGFYKDDGGRKLRPFSAIEGGNMEAVIAQMGPSPPESLFTVRVTIASLHRVDKWDEQDLQFIKACHYPELFLDPLAFLEIIKISYNQPRPIGDNKDEVPSLPFSFPCELLAAFRCIKKECSPNGR